MVSPSTLVNDMRTNLFLAVAGVLALGAGSAAAQTCAGTAPFSRGPVRLGAAVQSTRNVTGYGVEMAVGSAAGPFVSGSVSRADYKDVPDAATVFGASAGYAFDLNAAKTIQLCPQASYGYRSGPDIDLGAGTMTSSAHAFGFGGSIGGAVPVTPTLDLVPFAGAAYILDRTSAHLGNASEKISTDYRQVQLGAGFAVDKMLQPAVSFPLGVEGAKGTFQLAVGFNFGASKR